jgi:hypothetical protein
MGIIFIVVFSSINTKLTNKNDNHYTLFFRLVRFQFAILGT